MQVRSSFLLFALIFCCSPSFLLFALFWACRNALPLAAAAIVAGGGVDPSVAEFETECTALYLAVVDPALRDVAFAVRCPTLALRSLSPRARLSLLLLRTLVYWVQLRPLKAASRSSPLSLSLSLSLISLQLIELGADCKCASVEHGGTTALYQACKLGDAALAQSLIDGGAELNAAIDDATSAMNGWTPLMRACSNNNVEAAQVLLAAGADVDAQDAAGQNAAQILWDAHGVDLRALAPPGADVGAPDAEDEYGDLL